jgi:hypothetical protein
MMPDTRRPVSVERIAFVLAFLVASILIGIGVAGFRSARTLGEVGANRQQSYEETARRDTGFAFPSDSPCGPPVSLAEAAEEQPFDIYMPEHSLASESNLAAISSCPQYDKVVMTFESGVILLMEREEKPDHTLWARIAADHPITVVEEIRGVPAAVTDPAKDPSGATPGGIDLFEAGLLISVAGNGRIAISDLKAVAESLRPA